MRKLKILIDSSDDDATKNMRKLQKLIKNISFLFSAEGAASIATEDVCECVRVSRLTCFYFNHFLDEFFLLSRLHCSQNVAREREPNISLIRVDGARVRAHILMMRFLIIKM